MTDVDTTAKARPDGRRMASAPGVEAGVMAANRSD